MPAWLGPLCRSSRSLHSTFYFVLFPSCARLLLLSPSLQFPIMPVIDQETFEQLLPFAFEWAKAQEEFILARGIPLRPEQTADARRAGVQDCSRVRVLVVDRIPVPDNKELAEAGRRTQIITDASRGVAIGHGIIIRADCWGDRELLLHNLVHVAQC